MKNTFFSCKKIVVVWSQPGATLCPAGFIKISNSPDVFLRHSSTYNGSVIMSTHNHSIPSHGHSIAHGHSFWINGNGTPTQRRMAYPPNPTRSWTLAHYHGSEYHADALVGSVTDAPSQPTLEQYGMTPRHIKVLYCKKIS